MSPDIAQTPLQKQNFGNRAGKLNKISYQTFKNFFFTRFGNTFCKSCFLNDCRLGGFDHCKYGSPIGFMA